MARVGSISKRSDGRWVVKYKGRQTTCKTEADAKKKLKIFKAEETEVNTELSRKKVSDAVEAWLEYHRAYVKPLTYDRIEQSWNNHVKKYVGNIQMGSLRETDVENMLRAMAGKGYSFSTIKKAYEVLSACFRYYFDRRMIAYNPVSVVKVPSVNKKPKGEIVFFTDAELEKIYKEATRKYSNGEPVYRYGWIFVLLGNTGLRGSEIFGLRKDNIDLEQRTLTVKGNCVIAKNREPGAQNKTIIIEQKKPKTDGSMRTISLNDLAIMAIKELYKTSDGSPYLIISRNGNMVNTSVLDRSFRRILRAAGFPDEKMYGIHSLRHSFATGLISKGVHAKIVSNLLGHSDVKVTLQTYTHVLKDDFRDAVDKLNHIGAIV